MVIINMNGFEYEIFRRSIRTKWNWVFVGDKLSGADVILSFPIYENVFDNLEGTKRNMGDKVNKKMFPIYLIGVE